MKKLSQVETLYSRISKARDPTISVIPIIEKWTEEGKTVDISLLQSSVKYLRKNHRYTHALQISEWMTSQGSYTLSSTGAAIQLDLISKVHGLVKAEEYFNSIPEALREQQVYGALLNCYAHLKVLEKAEATMQKLKSLGPVKSSLPYNVMLNLYSRLGKHEKLDPLIREMEENGIHGDMFTYTIRLNAYVNSSDIEGMEELLMKMEVDEKISMDFHAYVSAANGYLKKGLTDKSIIMLKRAELKINRGLRRFAYEILLTLYAAAGSKTEVYRIWDMYKKIGWCFNSCYFSMITSLVKLDDIYGAEKIWEEWNSRKVHFDIKIPNLMINAYASKGFLLKAEFCLGKLKENGMEPDATSWDNLAAGYNVAGKQAKAVETIRKPILVSKPGCKPKVSTLSACLKYLKDQGDVETAKELLKMAMEHCHYKVFDYNNKLSRYVDNGNIAVIDQQKDDDQTFAEESPTATNLELTGEENT